MIAMSWHRILDLTLQSANVIVVAGCFLALLAAHYTANRIIQVAQLSESASVSTTTETVSVTELLQSTSTSTTCTPGHCSFTEVISLTMHENASLGGTVVHTTTVLNPVALLIYERLVDLGWYLAIVGLILSVANFSFWLYRRHAPLKAHRHENSLNLTGLHVKCPKGGAMNATC